jgi:cysteine desulfurase
MAHDCVYMDNHATTQVDQRVVDVMLPYFSTWYGNPGSTSHAYGWETKEAVDVARESIAAAIGASARELVFTSGATESNNLALKGLTDRARGGRTRIVSVVTEHRAVLDPLERLGRRGFEVTLLPVTPAGDRRAGWLDPQHVADAVTEDTLCVSVMLANNEIGVLQPLSEIAAICRERGVVLHCDATQAIGRVPVDVEELGVDLMSFTAHKIYGPKGIGTLYVRRRPKAVRLSAQIDGGGQEGGLRSGTLNVPGIIGFAKALELCVDEMNTEQPRLAQLRDRLFTGMRDSIEGVTLNGPALDALGPDEPGLRLAGNLNVSFAWVDGEALMLDMKRLAVSSGSACTSANPEPSHVLRALGIGEDLTRASLRFGLGRFNTAEEVEFAIQAVSESVRKLRRLSSLA